MIRSIATTAIFTVMLVGCARLGDAPQERIAKPAYVPTHDAARAPLLGVSTVTGDTVREHD